LVLVALELVVGHNSTFSPFSPNFFFLLQLTIVPLAHNWHANTPTEQQKKGADWRWISMLTERKVTKQEFDHIIQTTRDKQLKKITSLTPAWVLL
jgi:hypothetical protein